VKSRIPFEATVDVSTWTQQFIIAAAGQRGNRDESFTLMHADETDTTRKGQTGSRHRKAEFNSAARPPASPVHGTLTYKYF